MALTEILRRHRGPPVTSLGEEPVKEALIADLERYERKNGIVRSVTFGLSLILFVLALLAIYYDVRSGSNRLVPIAAASGVTVGSMFLLMLRAGREWTKSHLILGLARLSSEEDVRKLVENLIKTES